MKIQAFGPDPSVPYQKMYTALFNAVTSALDWIEGGDFLQAKAVLIQAQQDAEELYIEGDGPGEVTEI